MIIGMLASDEVNSRVMDASPFIMFYFGALVAIISGYAALGHRENMAEVS